MLIHAWGEIMSCANHLSRFVIAMCFTMGAACASDLAAKCEARKGDEAIKACTALLETAQQDHLRVEYLKARGQTYAGMNRHALAVADFTEAIRLDPQNQVLYTSRCWSKTVIGENLDDALKDCNTAQQLKPNKWGTLNAIGFIRLRQGRYTDAQAEFTAALAARPGAPESLFGRGIAELRLGQSDTGTARQKAVWIDNYYDSIGIGSDVTSETSSPEMKAMFDADQNARTQQPIDWKTLVPADEERRARTRALIELGVLKSGKDFEEAAFIFQHGSEANDYLLAHVLATIAVRKGDHNAVWIAAATLDRYLQKIGQKQVFGTQFLRANPNSPWTMEPYDRGLVPDVLRGEVQVPPIGDQNKELDEMQKRDGK